LVALDLRRVAGKERKHVGYSILVLTEVHTFPVVRTQARTISRASIIAVIRS